MMSMESPVDLLPHWVFRLEAIFSDKILRRQQKRAEQISTNYRNLRLLAESYDSLKSAGLDVIDGNDKFAVELIKSYEEQERVIGVTVMPRNLGPTAHTTIMLTNEQPLFMQYGKPIYISPLGVQERLNLVNEALLNAVASPQVTYNGGQDLAL